MLKCFCQLCQIEHFKIFLKLPKNIKLRLANVPMIFKLERTKVKLNPLFGMLLFVLLPGFLYYLGKLKLIRIQRLVKAKHCFALLPSDGMGHEQF